MAADDGDIEMGGTDGDSHSNQPGGGRTGAAVTEQQQQANNVSTHHPHHNHTTSSFEVKPDPDERQQSRSQSQSQPPQISASSSPPAPKMKTKKKGTAAAKKAAPKNKKKTPKGATKTAAAAAPSSKPKSAGDDGDEDENEDGDEGEGEGDDDETDNGPYCICRGPDDHRWMIGCDVCEDWFHGECVSLTKEVGEKLVERFVCPNCTDMSRGNYTKYKKTCSLAGCKNAARLYAAKGEKGGEKVKERDRSVFCSDDHCHAWWLQVIATMPAKAASRRAVEVLTQEDFVALLAFSSDGDDHGNEKEGGWKLGDRPFGNVQNLFSNGLPTREGVLSDEEQAFLKTSAAERLALGNEIVQYKKMMQLLDWASERRQAAIEGGAFTKDSCGYDWRLDTVTARAQFAVWLDSAEGQAVFKAGRLEAPITTTISTTTATDSATTTTAAVEDVGAGGDEKGKEKGGKENPLTAGTCDKKRCRPHNGWYKLLMGAVRVLIKETAKNAAAKLDAEDTMRAAAAARFERRQLERNTVAEVK
ncbi:hypothetical protein F5Y16DRAFT_383750 [Xylariaceae sp. FL0255]|nr:hypothetical protein F5Y16DRAFT_383750 [Xylariaceae sp. FL0255]